MTAKRDADTRYAEREIGASSSMDGHLIGVGVAKVRMAHSPWAKLQPVLLVVGSFLWIHQPLADSGGLDLARTLLFSRPDIERIVARCRPYSGEIKDDIPAPNRFDGAWMHYQGAVGANEFFWKVLRSSVDTNANSRSNMAFLAGVYSNTIWCVQGPELFSDNTAGPAMALDQVIEASIGPRTGNPAVAIASTGFVSISKPICLGISWIRPGSFKSIGETFTATHFNGVSGSGTLRRLSPASWVRMEFALPDWETKGVGRFVSFVRFAEVPRNSEIPPFTIVYGWVRRGRWVPTEEIVVVEIVTRRGKGLGEVCNPARFANPSPIRTVMSNGIPYRIVGGSALPKPSLLMKTSTSQQVPPAPF